MPIDSEEEYTSRLAEARLSNDEIRHVYWIVKQPLDGDKALDVEARPTEIGRPFLGDPSEEPEVFIYPLDGQDLDSKPETYTQRDVRIGGLPFTTEVDTLTDNTLLPGRYVLRIKYVGEKSWDRKWVYITVKDTLSTPKKLPTQVSQGSSQQTANAPGTQTTPNDARSSMAVPGTKVKLIPPAGYTAAARFPGFENRERQSSIMVTEMPAPFSELVKAFSDDPAAREKLKQARMTVLTQEQLSLGGADAMLVYLKQYHAGEEYLKWILISGDRNQSRMITATFKKGDEAILKEALRQSLLSASLVGATEPDPWRALGYKVEPAGTLKFAKIAVNSAIFNESGQVPKKNDAEASYIVTRSFDQVNLNGDNLKVFAQKRVEQTAGYGAIMIISSQAKAIGTLRGHEIIADALDDQTKEKVMIYQSVVTDGQGYHIMQGIAPRKRSEDILQHFRAMTASFTLKP